MDEEMEEDAKLYDQLLEEREQRQEWMAKLSSALHDYHAGGDGRIPVQAAALDEESNRVLEEHHRMVVTQAQVSLQHSLRPSTRVDPSLTVEQFMAEETSGSVSLNALSAVANLRKKQVGSAIAAEEGLRMRSIREGKAHMFFQKEQEKARKAALAAQQARREERRAKAKAQREAVKRLTMAEEDRRIIAAEKRAKERRLQQAKLLRASGFSVNDSEHGSDLYYGIDGYEVEPLQGIWLRAREQAKSSAPRIADQIIEARRRIHQLRQLARLQIIERATMHCSVRRSGSA